MTLWTDAYLGSRPVRGAWIETLAAGSDRGELIRRAPSGARGLKPGLPVLPVALRVSRPVRGAWIETCQTGRRLPTWPVAPRPGRVD